MTTKFLAIIFIILGIQADACAQKNDEMFTIYLVRHSEKDLSSEDPAHTLRYRASASHGIFLHLAATISMVKPQRQEKVIGYEVVDMMARFGKRKP